MTLRFLLRNLLAQAAKVAAKKLGVALPNGFVARVDYTPNIKLGHYATPVAMELAKVFKKSPRQIAESILDALDKSYFTKVEIAGAGFINLTFSTKTLSNAVSFPSVGKWLKNVQGEIESEKIIFEYVSANPTGPMNIVSARAASVGDSLTRTLKAAGCDVWREYYVNDFGNQVEMLGLSFAYRYLQKFVPVELPENCYQGEYIKDYLEKILTDEKTPDAILLTKERIDTLDKSAWFLEAGKYFAPLGVRAILTDQQKDLKTFRAEFDQFFSEASLHQKGAVLEIAEKLKVKGKIKSEDGAQVFLSTEYGDDKDRVVVRSDGRPTYLLADIAYHHNKVERGFKRIVDIWGPDHHGYIARLAGALKALGFENFKVIIAQQVNLLENGEPVVMSKRLGKFQTMRDLIEKIPVDVCRYFFVVRSLGTHLDFDLTLALDQSKKNPVYYIQYAHARIHSIAREVDFGLTKPLELERVIGAGRLYEFFEREELFLFLLRFPEVVQDIARNYEIQRLPEYLYQTATLFTAFYHGKNNRIKDVLQSNPDEGFALLALCAFTAQVLETGLSFLGISAPKEM
ncbi:MAG: Arginine--tRNA ligase [Turneriella sp.]|nr:Arginine--tRNA ligase [Turneriella sp.]